jgi:hypothetical protein
MIVTGITAPAVDFKFYAGVSVVIDINIVDVGNVPVPLAGNTLTWLIYSAGGATLMTKALNSGITVTNGPGGLCEIKISGAETADLNGVFLHKFLITDANGDTHMAFRGTITLE